MKKYSYKFPKSIFLNIIFITLALFIIFACQRKEYLELEKEIASMNIIDDSCYFTFHNDSYEYVCHNITDKNLDQLAEWDKITIWVQENYQNFEYGLIYQLEFKDNILFNDIDQYEEDNKIISNIAYLVLISIIAVSIAYLFTGFSKIKEVKEDFSLKETNYTYYLFALTLTISLVPIISILAYYFKGKISEDTLGFIFVFLIFLIPSVIGLYWAIAAKFEFKNKTYSYKNPFLKIQKAEISEIKRVELKTNAWGLQIRFYNDNDAIIMKFYDHGFVFKDGLFINSLLNHKIKFTNQEVNQVQEVMLANEMHKGENKLFKTYHFNNIEIKDKAIYIKRLFNEKTIYYQNIAVVIIQMPQNRKLNNSNIYDYHYFTFILKNENNYKINTMLLIEEAIEIINSLKEKEVVVETEYYNNVIDNQTYGD